MRDTGGLKGRAGGQQLNWKLSGSLLLDQILTERQGLLVVSPASLEFNSLLVVCIVGCLYCSSWKSWISTVYPPGFWTLWMHYLWECLPVCGQLAVCYSLMCVRCALLCLRGQACMCRLVNETVSSYSIHNPRQASTLSPFKRKPERVKWVNWFMSISATENIIQSTQLIM